MIFDSVISLLAIFMKKLWQVGNIQIIIAGLWYFQKLVPAWHKYDKLVVISNFMISLEQSDLVLMKVCSRYCISFSTLHLQCNRAIRYEILRKQLSTLLDINYWESRKWTIKFVNYLMIYKSLDRPISNFLSVYPHK